MWRRRRGPKPAKLTVRDGISLFDEALRQLGQPPLADNLLFERQESPEWMAEYHRQLSNGSTAWIEIFPEEMSVGAHFPEVFGAGDKHIRDHRGRTIENLCQVLSSRIEIIEKRPGRSYHLRFLDEEGNPVSGTHYWGRYEVTGDLLIDPIVPRSTPGA